jgi:hypothetical protein
VAEHLWGPGVDFDSDGNSATPDDPSWTELTVMLRKTPEERVDVDLASEAPLVLKVVSESRELALRTATFLTETTGGRLVPEIESRSTPSGLPGTDS